MMENQDNCPHEDYCVLITVYQKEYCTAHYAKQCQAKKVYDKALDVDEEEEEFIQNELEKLLGGDHER